MLKRLSVENYALIDRLELCLSSELNIITGETGAGKSILLGALGLVLGNRADTGVLKDGARNCVVEAQFDIEGYDLETFFDDNDIDFDAQTIIRRVITPAEKSRAYVNDLPVQLSVLKELAERLIDIHSQHQSRMVADEGFRIRAVDGIASNSDLTEDYRTQYKAFRQTERQLRALREECEQNKRDEDYIAHQHEQIARLKLREGEIEELEAEQRELSNAEHIQAALGLSVELLGEEEQGALPRLKRSEHALQQVFEAYPRAAEYIERIRPILLELRDMESDMGSEAERVEYNPERLAIVDNRLGAVYALYQKHKVESVEELLTLQKSYADRLALISDSDEAITELERQSNIYREQATELAERISKSRISAGKELACEIEAMLRRLGMESARFECLVEPAGELGADGADKVRFVFSSSGGQVLQPLEKVASGGEVSRVMLALKSIVARNSRLPSIIFDEIDTGVSGRIADAMGDIIAELSRSMQVINITHLPQVAAKGDTHFVVYKDSESGVTRTHIQLLDDKRRIEEIAKMLSGSAVTDAALAQARLLLGK